MEYLACIYNDRSISWRFIPEYTEAASSLTSLGAVYLFQADINSQHNEECSDNADIIQEAPEWAAYGIPGSQPL